MKLPKFINVADRYLIRLNHIQIIDISGNHLKLTMRDGVSFEVDFVDEAEKTSFQRRFFENEP